MLKRFSEADKKQWEHIYLRYNKIYLIYLLIVITTPLAAAKLKNWNIQVLVPFEILLLLLFIGYLPTLLWEIKTGYLSSPIKIPISFFKFKIKVISRQHTPRVFWALIIGQIAFILLFATFVIHSFINK